MAKLSCDIYLFGSAIYESGDQFDAQTSDIDLVIVFHGVGDPVSRVDFLLTLRDFKLRLELELIPALRRTNCEEPGVSIVPVTLFEIQANIHKSSARHFFDRNTYLNLATLKQSIGLDGAGSVSIPDEARQAIEFVQFIRNKLLSLSANKSGGILPFDGLDPVPKALARAAAQLVKEAPEGAWYDTRFGLELIWDELSARRTESPTLQELFHRLSKRRGGRGKKEPLSDRDQLLLAELLYDRAVTLGADAVTTWEIRFGGVTPTPAERERLVQELRDLVPGAEILGVFPGSIVVRLRGAKRGLEFLLRLKNRNVLEAIFGVAKVDIATVQDGERSVLRPEGAIDRIIGRIAEWRPSSQSSMAETEMSLAAWLDAWEDVDRGAPGYALEREVVISGERPLRVDFVVHVDDRANESRVAIELVRLRNRTSFFDQVDRLRHISISTILVVVGAAPILADLRTDIARVSDIDSRIRIVPVQFDNG